MRCGLFCCVKQYLHDYLVCFLQNSFLLNKNAGISYFLSVILILTIELLAFGAINLHYDTDIVGTGGTGKIVRFIEEEPIKIMTKITIKSVIRIYNKRRSEIIDLRND